MSDEAVCDAANESNCRRYNNFVRFVFCRCYPINTVIADPYQLDRKLREYYNKSHHIKSGSDSDDSDDDSDSDSSSDGNTSDSDVSDGINLRLS